MLNWRLSPYAYSHRLSWTSSSNRLSTAVARRRSTGKQFLDLTNSNPTVGLSNYPHAAIAGALGAISTFQYAPESLGSLPARESISRYYAERSLRAAPEDILLTASTSEAYAVLFKLLCDPGDEVLIPHPSYPLFDYLAALECVRTVPYRLHYDGTWYADWDHARSQLTTRTKAIVIVNPNNPTGSYLKTSDCKELLGIAAQHNLAVISDEVFMDYALTEDGLRVQSLAGECECLIFCLNGLSKMAGMPQMKLAWMVLAGDQAAKSAARERLELILDTYLSIGTPVQAALPDLLSIGASIRADIRSLIKANSATLQSILCGSAAHPLRNEGGWSAILHLPAVLSEEEWALRLLEDANILVQPGYFFDMQREPFAVVSLLTDSHLFEAGTQALRSLVSEITQA